MRRIFNHQLDQATIRDCRERLTGAMARFGVSDPRNITRDIFQKQPLLVSKRYRNTQTACQYAQPPVYIARSTIVPASTIPAAVAYSVHLIPSNPLHADTRSFYSYPSFRFTTRPFHSYPYSKLYDFTACNSWVSGEKSSWSTESDCFPGCPGPVFPKQPPIFSGSWYWLFLCCGGCDRYKKRRQFQCLWDW